MLYALCSMPSEIRNSQSQIVFPLIPTLIIGIICYNNEKLM